MNLLLLRDEDFLADGTVRLSGRRLLHARAVLRAQVGSTLRVGKLGGAMGAAKILADDSRGLLLEVRLEDPPPPRAPLDLLLAIPRPKALKKVLPAVASLGVRRLVLVNAARVEKSYFDSHVLAPETLEALFCLGLEQARDTVLPELSVRARFRPFVEDELDTHFGPGLRVLAHPGVSGSVPAPSPETRVLLAIGPEGGWVPFEVELLQSRGFLPFSPGPRILRTEVAVSYLAGLLAGLPLVVSSGT